MLGYVLGVRVERISIEQQGSSAGHVQARAFRHQRSAVYALAGYAAEQVLLDVPAVWQLHQHEGGDLLDALGILKEWHGRSITVDDAEFLEAWARSQAATRTASRRIRAVARVLLRDRVVEGRDRVRRVLEGRGLTWYTRTLRAIHRL